MEDHMDKPKPRNATNRRAFLKGSMTAGLASAAGTAPVMAAAPQAPSKIWITDLKCAIMGGAPVVRITTNAGVDGYGQAESAKNYLKPHVLYYRDYLLGMDPTDVERAMLKIRRLGSFKPWGSAVSAIEMALWDIAGKVAGVPVYKLMGGKIRDRVRVYNGGVRPRMKGADPQDYAEAVSIMKESKEGFTMIKMGIGFHSRMASTVPDFFYGEPVVRPSHLYDEANPGATPGGRPSPKHAPHPNKGLLTEKGLKHIVACVEAMKKVLGDEVGLALDVGPGHTVSDAIRLAKALEPMNVMWLEDMITGDYTPYVLADLYREVTLATTTPIHTGEQIYLRQHFKELFEKQAVRVVGPDPADIGGIAELKWVTEYADLYGIQMAPHGIFDGLFGLAAHVQVGCALPENFIAFEYPVARNEWWYDIVDGLPDPIVKDSHVEVWDKPGLGVEFNTRAARKYLEDEDKGFFD
jgi:L-alanine-DL-glutamate epimerase-like enolase superfamily enzyme